MSICYSFRTSCMSKGIKYNGTFKEEFVLREVKRDMELIEILAVLEFKPHLL